MERTIPMVLALLLPLLLFAPARPAPTAPVALTAATRSAVRPAGARASLPDGAEEALRRLAYWARRARRAGNARNPPDGPGDLELRDLRAVLGELDRLGEQGALGEQARDRWTRLLVDLIASREGRDPRGGSPDGLQERTAGGGEASWRRVSDLAERALRARCGRAPEALGARLSKYLALPEAIESKNLRETLSVLKAIRGCPLEPLLAPLVSLAGIRPENEAQGEVRRRAEEALIGWPDPRVSSYLLGRAEAGSLGVGALARHLLALGPPGDERIQPRLRSLAARLLASEDWRDASRGLDLVACLDSEHAVPLLIEGLDLWSGREGTETGSRRIRGELVSRLRKRSGRSLGAEPAAWRRWWGLVTEGRIALPAETGGEGELYSSAPFFGLHLETDRVVFVLDNSGSMASPLRTDGTSRYEVAIGELVGFLRASGPSTRFQIVLFSDGARMWQRGAVRASPDQIERARRWLRSHKPGGSTMLYEGIREALHLDTRGHPREPGPEADTVVVLCDGATTEGKGWVGPWLRRENERARLVFQCVQIGRTGNGTLEALAEGSGGRCVYVE